MSEPLCPMTPDGRHKRKPFHGKVGVASDAVKRSGLACERCHKTWRFENGQLVPTMGD